MKARLLSLAFVMTLLLFNCGCGRLPGKPTPTDVPVMGINVTVSLHDLFLSRRARSDSSQCHLWRDAARSCRR